MTQLNTPVLFLVFNRPDLTERVFEAIRQARPARLYIAADGPRSTRDGEAERVSEVRRISTQVDWPCEVNHLFREQNLGCKMAVSEAISWFFKHEEEGIILEDDCLPEQSFFPFCQQLLEKYRHDTRVMAISGDNFQQGRSRTEYSYYFSRYNHVWGWGSWRRAWNLYDRDMLTWPEAKRLQMLKNMSENDLFAKFWSIAFDSYASGKVDTWDYPWTYSCWAQSGLTILPTVNLISNIGFGSEATHTKRYNDKNADLPVQSMKFPLAHPPVMMRDAEADAFTDRNNFKIQKRQNSFFCRLIKAVQLRICP